jgi:hypothetical protein
MNGWEAFAAVGLSAVLVMAAGVGTAADLHLVTADGTPIRWQDWLADRETCAVLVWASWTPAADDSRIAVGAFVEAARARGLDLVVVAVQESFDDSHRALSRTPVTWLHDRHGTILKEYRLIEVPSLIIVGGDGSLRVRLEATPEALAAWTASR